MGRHGFRIAQIIGDINQLQRIHEAEAGFLAALDVKTHQGATGRHLRHGELLLRVIRPEGIEHTRNLCPFRQHIGNGGSAAAHGGDAQMQRFQPFQDYPGIEGADGRAGIADEGLQNLIHPFL